MKAEIRSVKDITGEYNDYFVIIYEGKSLPYMHIPSSMPMNVLKLVIQKINQ